MAHRKPVLGIVPHRRHPVNRRQVCRGMVTLPIAFTLPNPAHNPTRRRQMTKFDPQKHHRRSIRLQGYDYTSSGAYFITICFQGQECLLGEVASDTCA